MTRVIFLVKGSKPRWVQRSSFCVLSFWAFRTVQRRAWDPNKPSAVSRHAAVRKSTSYQGRWRSCHRRSSVEVKSATSDITHESFWTLILMIVVTALCGVIKLTFNRQARVRQKWQIFRSILLNKRQGRHTNVPGADFPRKSRYTYFLRRQG